MNDKTNTPKVLIDTSDLEATIGHIIADSEVREDVEEWLKSCDGDIEKFLTIWLSKETGTLKLFGAHMKCVEAIGYLEVAKCDLLDCMNKGDEDEDEEDNR